LQFLARKKPQPLAVGREERINGSFCAGNRAGLKAIHSPQIDLLDAALNRNIGELRAIGRQSQRCLIQSSKPLPGWQSNHSATDGAWGSRLRAPNHKASNSCQKKSQGTPEGGCAPARPELFRWGSGGCRELGATLGNPPQFARKVTRALPTFVRKFFKAFSYRMIQCWRRQRFGGGDRIRLLLKDCACHTQLALAFKCAFACHYFVQHPA